MSVAGILAKLPKPHGDGDDDDDEPGRGIEALLAKADKAETVARTLYQENFQLRQQRRDLRTEVKGLKEKLPADGTLVLTKEEAEAWESYKKLGKPGDIEKSIEEGKKAAESLAQRDRAAQVGDAAKAVGFNPEALTQLFGMHSGLELTSRTIKVNDKDTTAWYIKDANGQETELAAYAQQNWGTFMPSLQAQGGQGGQGGQQQGQQQQGQQQPWIQQGQAGGGQGGGQQGGIGDIAAGIMAGRGGTNPLMKPAGGGQGGQNTQANGVQGQPGTHTPGQGQQ
jgi:hypothetical protein